jgi:trimethylamine:corrinoid methyltransferase-like protein
LGLFGNLTGLPGTLAQGQVFSPTQMMLDYDLHQFLARYTAAPVVNEADLGVDMILEIGWDGTGYLLHEHTREYMRKTWQAAVFQRALPSSAGNDPGAEEPVLTRARELWRENRKRYEPPNHPDDFLRALHAICDQARKSLVG